MSRHLEKILAHAERELTSTGAQRPTDVLPVYRRFLKIEEHRLRLRQRAGDGGREVCARRVDLIDVLLRHVFAAANHVVNDRNGTLPIALVALGGYGRRELNPCSDVDVMFLHREQGRNVSKATSQIIEQVLYLLWDIGFKVGHSGRTTKEAIAAANADMVTKTAMLESRLVTGDRELEEKFRQQFRAKCVAGHEREYIEMRMRDQQARHAKFGNSVYLQEPNLKSGCGSLRDYQNLLWMTFFKEGSLTTTHLVGKDWLSEPDRRRIEAAYDFLLRVRTELHYLHHRATDVLHLNMQETMAQRLRYPQERGLLRSEALMKDVYAHSRNIFRVTERITAQFASGFSSVNTCPSSASLLVWCSMNFFTAIPRTNTRWSALTSSTRWRERKIPNCLNIGSFSSNWPILLSFIWRCCCMTPARLSEPGHIRKRARFLRNAQRAVFSSIRVNARC